MIPKMEFQLLIWGAGGSQISCKFLYIHIPKFWVFLNLIISVLIHTEDLSHIVIILLPVHHAV